MSRDKGARELARAACVALIAAAFAGCSGGSDESAPAGELAPNIVQPGAPGEPSRTLSADELAEIEIPKHTDADVSFMQGMIHHHAQALRMTALAPTNGAGRDVRRLARRIDVSQVSEIELMEEWLEARGEAVPELHRKHGHAHGIGLRPDMPGMLSEPQLKQLARARGPAFDRVFLRSMIFHHEGALAMVQELYAANGGLEPAVDAFARHVDSDQAIEIARMREVLSALDAD